jgi:hypothetical protein
VESTTPPDQHQYTPDSPAPTPLILPPLPALAAHANDLEADAALFLSPSLHVLQCVWRC